MTFLFSAFFQMSSIVGMKLVFWKFLGEANIIVPTQNEGSE